MQYQQQEDQVLYGRPQTNVLFDDIIDVGEDFVLSRNISKLNDSANIYLNNKQVNNNPSSAFSSIQLSSNNHPVNNSSLLKIRHNNKSSLQNKRLTSQPFIKPQTSNSLVFNRQKILALVHRQSQHNEYGGDPTIIQIQRMNFQKQKAVATVSSLMNSKAASVYQETQHSENSRSFRLQKSPDSVKTNLIKQDLSHFSKLVYKETEERDYDIHIRDLTQGLQNVITPGQQRNIGIAQQISGGQGSIKSPMLIQNQQTDKKQVRKLSREDNEVQGW